MYTVISFFKCMYDFSNLVSNKHLPPELLQGENYNPRPSIMAGFEVGGWLDWLRPIGRDSIAKIFFYLVLIAGIPQGHQIHFIFHLFLFLVRGTEVCSDYISFLSLLIFVLLKYY